MNTPHDEQDLRLEVERLQARISELEDFQQRVEASAAEMVAMAEELAIAKEAAEMALSREREYQKKIERLALYDPLTGISNRNYFEKLFEEALQHADREEANVALLLFDLDNFKEVNDNFGHPVGDELLRFVSERLLEATRETDTVARLGGDEFAVILTHLDREDGAARIAERVIDLLSDPVTLSGCLIRTGTSIGISVYPHDGGNQEELLRTADKALYASKSLGRGTYQFYDEKMDQKTREAHMLENDLRLAIVRKEFVLHFQPQVMADAKDVIGVEALVRWQHPTRGILMPAEFIELAERTGLIVEIGRLVLEAACLQCKQWNRPGSKPIRIAVNVSPIQFKDPNFIGHVTSILDETGMDPTLLELEITESLMMESIVSVAENLRQLHALGVTISVDDFGTGYSSLAYLKNLPIHRLKIDKSFIEHLVDNENDSAIAGAIINMGHSLNLQVVAEGIETEVQAADMNLKGCDHLQGYFVSRPLPPDEFARWLADQGNP